MVNVSIRFFAAFRELIGKKEIKLELGGQENHTVLGAIEKLIENRGNAIRIRLFDDDGNLRKGVQIFLNGRKIHISNKMETPIKNNDRIAILPTVGGG